MAKVLKFPARPSPLVEIDRQIDAVRSERSKAHAIWRAKDDELHRLMMKRFAVKEGYEPDGAA